MPRPRGGRTVDYKEWDAIPQLTAEVGSDTTLAGGGLAFLGSATILRCRGYVEAHLDETKQVGDLAGVVFGLGIVSSDAHALGSTALPDPASEPEYPWLWWGVIQLEAYVAAGEESWGSTAQRLEVDTKGMRRIKPGQTLAWVAQTRGLSGAPVTRVIMGQTRVLIGI